MDMFHKISRRLVLAGQATMAGLAAVPALARVAPEPGAAPVATAASTGQKLPLHWHTATAVELEDLVGERFRVQMEGRGSVVLKLVGLDPHVDNGGARPADLPRRAGVTALFESPDMGPLIESGEGSHRISHPRIGAATFTLAAEERRSGGHYITLVLN